jgi:hypothetical protein
VPLTVNEAPSPAIRVQVGGNAATVTLTDRLVVPPAPVQASVKLLLAVNAALTWLPDVALEPDQAPEALQLVAPVEDQVRVVVAPPATEVGLALSVTVGAATGANVAVTFRAALIVTAHAGAVPVQEPLHAMN